jgi:hypothetical protein
VTPARLAAPQRIRPVMLFIAVTGIHVASSIVLLLYVFGAGMARFDSGAAASATESVAGWAFAILSFPLLTLLERIPAVRFPGLWGYVPVVANGAIWGLAAVLVQWRLRARAPQRRAR